ncbi:Gfo/Idh/MocA family protein [Streptomyces sp. NPDC059697]|uniref:Gfo/Idh/MocA family protein n=1 Tax=Streptomyces sp. NPDC059697 TaxID=3346912 RepID=UPI0036C99C0B
MKLGIIGLGAISPFFIEAVERSDEVTLAAVCDTASAKTEPFAGQGVAAFSRYQDLLAADVCDAVVITLPNHLHAEAAEAALDAGLAVCCEKPLAVTTAEAARMTHAARRNNGVLFTAFHRRYNTNLVALKEQLPADPTELSRVVVRYHENIAEHMGGEGWYLQPEQCGGGCVIDNGPNALDEARFLLGDLLLTDASIGDVRMGAEFCAELDLKSAAGVPVRVELDWALQTGEVKDVTVELRNGDVLHADMLAGYDGFKASLSHEYDGILADFRRAVEAGFADYRDPGPDIVALVEEAYRVGRTKHTRLRMSSKNPVSTKVVRLLFHVTENRGMTLSPWGSRAIPAGQIHELVTTTDRPSAEGDRVDRAGFLGFVEFQDPAMLCRGDEVWVRQPGRADRRIGTLAGFDECHYPNHYNVLIDSDRLWTAGDISLEPGDEIRFVEGPQEEIG